MENDSPDFMPTTNPIEVKQLKLDLANYRTVKQTTEAAAIHALISIKPDSRMERKLHGAMVELGKKDGVLSVKSFNQLIHNPRFSITESDICIYFSNVLPLLEEMNK